MDDIVAVILNKMPVGVIVYDKKLQMIYSNRMAANFLKRYLLPDEIPPLTRRIFDAMDKSSLHELFPAKFICSGDLMARRATGYSGFSLPRAPNRLSAFSS